MAPYHEQSTLVGDALAIAARCHIIAYSYRVNVVSENHGAPQVGQQLEYWGFGKG